MQQTVLLVDKLDMNNEQLDTCITEGHDSKNILLNEENIADSFQFVTNYEPILDDKIYQSQIHLENVIFCDLCGKVFIKKHELQKHIREEHLSVSDLNSITFKLGLRKAFQNLAKNL